MPTWAATSAGTFGFPAETAADVALRTVRDHLLGETGMERVTFVLRPNAVEISGAGSQPSDRRARFAIDRKKPWPEVGQGLLRIAGVDQKRATTLRTRWPFS